MIFFSFHEIYDLFQKPVRKKGENLKISSGDSISNNVIIISESDLVIEKGSFLENVVLIAPKIVFKNGFTGNLQAFASDYIEIQERCELKYPSVLGLLNKKKKDQEVDFVIKDNSVISGLIFATGSNKNRQKPKVKILSNTLIQGQVVIDGNLELKGEVSGEVICQNLYLETPSSYYDNYLLNSTIDPSKFKFGHLFPFKNSEKKKSIVKWLDY